jgi:hypothetical protein
MRVIPDEGVLVEESRDLDELMAKLAELKDADVVDGARIAREMLEKHREKYEARRIAENVEATGTICESAGMKPAEVERGMAIARDILEKRAMKVRAERLRVRRPVPQARRAGHARAPRRAVRVVVSVQVIDDGGGGDDGPPPDPDDDEVSDAPAGAS